jgi:hypothetical protein
MGAVYRLCHVLAITALVWSGRPIAAAAQDEALPIPIGDVVYVTDIGGTTVKGKLAAMTADTVSLRGAAGPRQMPTDTIRDIRWQRRDSILNGVLIGAGVGAIPGLYWLAVDPNECTGLCPEEYAFIAIGAVAGGLIDYAITRKVTIYPVVTRSGYGLQASFTWRSRR